MALCAGFNPEFVDGEKAVAVAPIAVDAQVAPFELFLLRDVECFADRGVSVPEWAGIGLCESLIRYSET